ncbi:MAG: FxsA family protein, partial [Mariprofundaceae bacterium]|nr:FxsA family protein [Mariprofundaceae bacterium]
MTDWKAFEKHNETLFFNAIALVTNALPLAFYSQTPHNSPMLIKIILFLFIVVPLLELYVLIEVGSDIGGIATIALCLFTAALGGIIIRIQGIRTLLSAQQQMAQGAVPAEDVLHGIFLAVAGLL